MATVLRVPLGRSFCCVLPGHQERNPSAAIWKGRDGAYRYRDFHARDGRDAYDLVTVYAAVRARRFVRLTSRTLPRWKLRLCAEAELIVLPDARLPRLPSHASEDAKRLRDGFKLLLQLRRACGDDEPLPYTRAFAADWCALPVRRAERAKVELIDAHVIEKVGQHPIGNGAMSLYVPGQGRRSR